MGGVERGGGAGFAQKTGAQGRIIAMGGPEALDGDGPPETAVDGKPDDAHAAFADDRADLVIRGGGRQGRTLDARRPGALDDDGRRVVRRFRRRRRQEGAAGRLWQGCGRGEPRRRGHIRRNRTVGERRNARRCREGGIVFGTVPGLRRCVGRIHGVEKANIVRNPQTDGADDARRSRAATPAVSVGEKGRGRGGITCGTTRALRRDCGFCNG